MAARIGPTVCELEGPMPILKISKTLIAIAAARIVKKIPIKKSKPTFQSNLQQ
ncbi:hypothetical protein NP590_07475 [Methylomonas sp. SURF-2]|uniref:Uncharacterized protein n=1 Tax=Methylomonas subterranea TaxID=2952225 RepID=A0ABT1TGP3_9GAMM|nr:hypothetical protein [Methylomonas sp. SURF-2]